MPTFGLWEWLVIGVVLIVVFGGAMLFLKAIKGYLDKFKPK